MVEYCGVQRRTKGEEKRQHRGTLNDAGTDCRGQAASERMDEGAPTGMIQEPSRPTRPRFLDQASAPGGELGRKPAPAPCFTLRSAPESSCVPAPSVSR